jgi:hypothetical protein
MSQLTAEVAARRPLTERDRILIGNATALVIQAEALQTQVARGVPVDPDVLVRISNALARTMTSLAAAAGGKHGDPGTELAQYLRSKAAA